MMPSTHAVTTAMSRQPYVNAILALYQRYEPHSHPGRLPGLQRLLAEQGHYAAVVGVFGKTGSGKSQLCNALCGYSAVEVNDLGPTRHYPQEITLAYHHGIGLSLIDTPGLCDNHQQDLAHLPICEQLLDELDLLLWVVRADDRASLPDWEYLQHLMPLRQQRQLPLLLVINQCDKIAPSEQWDYEQQRPGKAQAMALQYRSQQIKRQFELKANQIAVVSARQGYGLCDLLEQILALLPQQKLP